MKKIIIPAILFIAVLIFSFFALSREKNKNRPTDRQDAQSQIILFYGDGCPHCAIVEEYIKQNQIENRISLAQKEVYNNQDNAKELEEKAKICGLPTDNIGVPFLWNGSKCFVGDRDIVDFLSKKLMGNNIHPVRKII